MIISKNYNNLIPISICVTDICQLKCEYCFQTSHSLKFLSKQKLDIILDQLRKIKVPMEIIMMGGEPTLYPFLNYLIDELYKIKNVRRILIFTNGLRPVDRIHFNNKLKITFSYHCTQKNKQFIINNLKFLKQNNSIEFDVNVMMVPNKRIDISEFKKYCNVKPLYIETKRKIIFYNSCDDLYGLKEIDYDGEKLTIKEFLEKPRNFKNRKCFSSEYSIELNLSCNNSCLQTKIDIDKFSKFINSHS